MDATARGIADESVLTYAEAVNLLGLLNGDVPLVEKIAEQATLTAAVGGGYGFAAANIDMLSRDPVAHRDANKG